MAKKSVIKIINRYLELLRKNGLKIDKAYLFGSFARGDENHESDIDLMIVSKIFDSENDKAVGLAWKITRQVDSRIEPYLVGLEKFNNDDISPLLQIVKQEGISLV
jgi:predicted nucleotidyltransferase